MRQSHWLQMFTLNKRLSSTVLNSIFKAFLWSTLRISEDPGHRQSFPLVNEVMSIHKIAKRQIFEGTSLLLEANIELD